MTSVNFQSFRPAINRITHSINRIFSGVLYYLDSHFTFLSILVISLIETILIFVTGYICRYSKYDFWRWKSRALFRSIRLCIILFLIKGVLQIIK